MRLRLAVLALFLVSGLVPSTSSAREADCADGGVFCAGASTADITPPVTSPQFAYTFRHCAATDAVDVAAHVGGVEGTPSVWPDHVEEGLAWVLTGGPPCLSGKAAPDTDGYAKTFPPSEGTYGRLQANAFVLVDEEGDRAAIVQVDLGGVPGEVHEAVAKRVGPLTGITRENLMISATHTHGGPGGIFQYQGYALLGGDEFDPRIYEAVVGGISRAIVEAYARLEPAKLATGEGQVHDANHNRRTSAWKRNPEAQGHDHGGVPPADAPRLVVTRVDTRDGVPLGVITNYANHGVIHGTFNLYFSGDNQGQATRQVARAIRAEAEASGVEFPEGWEVVDTLTNGATGDITPDCDEGGWEYSQYGRVEIPFEEFACMENGGARQVPEALRVWRELGEQLSPKVDVDARFDQVCFCGQVTPDDPYDPYDRGAFVPPNDDPEYFRTSVQAILGTDDGSSFPTTVFPSHHKEKPRIIGTQTNPSITRIQVLRVGDTAFATVPGEPTIQMGRRIERSVGAALDGVVDRVVTVGLANDYDSYMATIHEYEDYRYEGTFSLFGQQTGNLLKYRLVELAEQMRYGRPTPPCTFDRGCLEHPDTTAVAGHEPKPITPDLRVGEVEAQPADVERFTGTSFAWIGGGPGAEWTPDDALVEVQRLVDGDWETVASDLDPEVPVHYDKHGGVHHWRAFFDPVKDQAPGTYRFVVSGHAGASYGVRTPYTLASEPFEVAPSTALWIARDGARFAVKPPAPDAAANYRYRDPVAETAVVRGTLDGVEVVLGATFTLEPGQTLVVEPGGIVDAWGNTNADRFELTG